MRHVRCVSSQGKSFFFTLFLLTITIYRYAIRRRWRTVITFTAMMSTLTQTMSVMPETTRVTQRRERETGQGKERSRAWCRRSRFRVSFLLFFLFSFFNSTYDFLYYRSWTPNYVYTQTTHDMLVISRSICHFHTVVIWGFSGGKANSQE